MFGIGMTELMVIFVIGLLVLGPKRLPEMARSLGKSMAEFRRASNEMRREFMSATEDARIEPDLLAPPRTPAVPASTAGETGTPAPPEPESAPEGGAASEPPRDG